MPKLINFIYNEGFYSRVLDSFIDPVVRYIPNAVKSPNYLNGHVNISFFIEEQPHQGIFMSHGIADKKWRDGAAVSDYEYVFVSGPIWKEKMLSEGVPDSKILINGYTRMDPVFRSKKAGIRSNKKIRVLYAPTHNMHFEEEDSVSSFPRLLMYFYKIPQDIELVMSPHPANNESKITFEFLLSSDVVISDCSSILYEAWALGIPVVFPDWLVKDSIIKYYPQSFEDKIYSDIIGFHAGSIDEMWELIRKAKETSMDNSTKKFIDEIFPPELRGNSGKVTADFLLKMALEDDKSVTEP